MREISCLRAVNEAVDEEMAKDSSIFLMGEDIGKAWGGALGEFKGLYDKYGAKRVKDTPISETAILGSAIGAAATGMRPIAHLMFTDFWGVCGDDLINQLQMRYMFGEKVTLPLTVFSYGGAGVSAAAQHSKSLYGWLIAVKCIKVVVPTTPRDFKGLLKSAIRDDNPVLFLQSKTLLLSDEKGPVPEGEYTIPLGKADIKREGSDVTVVAIGMMVRRAIASADKLNKKGVSIEVIDPRTLIPLDKEAIINSVKKTGRLVIMEDDPKTGGVAGEIAAIVAEEAFDSLKAPIRRVCAPDTPVPFSPILERSWLPDEEDLIKAVTEIV